MERFVKIKIVFIIIHKTLCMIQTFIITHLCLLSHLLKSYFSAHPPIIIHTHKHTHTFHFSDSSTEMTMSLTHTHTHTHTHTETHTHTHRHKSTHPPTQTQTHHTQLQGLCYISSISALMVSCRGKQDSPWLTHGCPTNLHDKVTHWLHKMRSLSGSLALILETFQLGSGGSHCWGLHNSSYVYYLMSADYLYPTTLLWILRFPTTKLQFSLVKL